MKQHRAGGTQIPLGDFCSPTGARDALAVLQGTAKPSSCCQRAVGADEEQAPGDVPSALAHPRGHLVPYPHPSCPILYPWGAFLTVWMGARWEQPSQAARPTGSRPLGASLGSPARG